MSTERCEKVTCPKVLVACPNHIVKEYSFPFWIDTVTNLTYPNYDVLVVDNSPNGELAERYGRRVPIVKLDTVGIEDEMDRAWTRMDRSMEAIRQYFLTGDYEYGMNIESDVIPQPDVIEKLLFWGRSSDWISHAYPNKGRETLAEQGIGCSLLSRRLIESVSWDGVEERTTPDNWLWQHVQPLASEYPTVQLWGHLEVQHLGPARRESGVGRRAHWEKRPGRAE